MHRIIKLYYEERVSFLAVLTIFAVFVVFGAFINFDSPEESTFIKPNNVLHLFSNNVIASFTLMTGFVTFGISTVIFLALNGIIVGISIREQYENGLPIFDIFMKLAPHGIFEIPALLFASIIGFKSISIVLKILFSHSTFKNVMKKELINTSMIVGIIFLFLMIAAFVEWYIT